MSIVVTYILQILQQAAFETSGTTFYSTHGKGEFIFFWLEKKKTDEGFSTFLHLNGFTCFAAWCGPSLYQLSKLSLSCFSMLAKPKTMFPETPRPELFPLDASPATQESLIQSQRYYAIYFWKFLEMRERLHTLLMLFINDLKYWLAHNIHTSNNNVITRLFIFPTIMLVLVLFNICSNRV